MKISAPVHIEAIRRTAPIRSELTLRYAAAYGCTLLSLLAAQLYITSPLIVFALGGVVLLGWPLSLSMRERLREDGVHLGNGRVISRFVINSSVVVVSGAAALALIGYTLGGLGPGILSRFLAGGDARTAFGLLMECILVFTCCRCLAILTDKDAALSTLPTYAVLLLLMVVLNGATEVVFYFLLWILVAVTLLALDHRAEAHHDATGVVPSLVPGQDANLSARGLATVLAASLMCAGVLSTLLSNGDPNNRGASEGVISAIASRLNALSLNLPDVSVNAGPERQIDFTTGPSLPTRAELWRVSCHDIDTGHPIEPTYWRMFTYGQYDGHGWSQIDGLGTRVARTPLDERHWPLKRANNRLFPGFAYIHAATSKHPVSGFDVAANSPDQGKPSRTFGMPGEAGATMRVAQKVVARAENIGYIPALPSVRGLAFSGMEMPSDRTGDEAGRDDSVVRVRDDYAVDVGVIYNHQTVFMWSEVTGDEYGNGRIHVPTKLSEKPNPTVRLTPKQLASYTFIPTITPLRVKRFAQNALHGAARDENNYARARRLLVAVQQGSIYTLRPPVPPQTRDAVDYFLNEGGKRGYCTYFASALALTCREVGIPSRVVTGFVAPELQDDGSYLIRESMSHAWTEVWVPGWGWATLDATPAGDRGNNAPSVWDNAMEALGSVLELGRVWSKAHWLPLTCAGVLAALIGLVVMAWRWWTRSNSLVQASLQRHLTWMWRRYKKQLSSDEIAREDARRLYENSALRLGQVFRRRASWETPIEWLRGAEAGLSLPDWSPLHHLTDLYVRAQYSPLPLSPEEVAAVRESLTGFVWKPAGRKGRDRGI